MHIVRLLWENGQQNTFHLCAGLMLHAMEEDDDSMEYCKLSQIWWNITFENTQPSEAMILMSFSVINN